MNVEYTLPDFPENWVAYYRWNSSVAYPRIILDDRSSLRNLIRLWYEKALDYHNTNQPWTKEVNMAWVRASPPGYFTEMFDDLGYTTYIPLADFAKTCETGVLS